jgi:hypothetical protein
VSQWHHDFLNGLKSLVASLVMEPSRETLLASSVKNTSVSPAASSFRCSNVLGSTSCDVSFIRDTAGIQYRMDDCLTGTMTLSMF